MLFTTLSFLIFFAVVYAGNWMFRDRGRILFLLFASVVFYAAWSIGFAFHFVGIVVLNHFLIHRMQETRQKAYFYLLLFVDSVNLFVFKYFYLMLHALFDLFHLPIFTSESFNAWLESQFQFGGITLPLAISFYTFQLIAYAVDVHRGVIAEKTKLTDFMLFIMFFPQLVAGPIMRHSDFFYQLGNSSPEKEKIVNGMRLILLGLIKKVVIADNVAPAITGVYLHPEQYDWISNLIAPFGYAVRVYCDFSGYTDIARGTAMMIGFDLPENFKAPYLSRSVSELWKRWHVTLSSWLRDYIYIPLGGSRASTVRTGWNLILTFVLGGLWHGANYTYAVWGFFHGVMLVIERTLGGLFRTRGKKEHPAAMTWIARLTAVLAIAYSFLAFVIGLIPFNAPDMTTATTMFVRIVTLADGGTSPHNRYILTLLPVVFFFNYVQTKKRMPPFLERYPHAFTLIFGMFTLFLLGKFAPGGADFIYFQF